MWQKTSKTSYRGTVNGRIFTLRCNRSKRSFTPQSTPFVCIGRKPRTYVCTTWYDVYETLADGSEVKRTDLNNLPGTLAEAKAFASRCAGN
jgi:hypothetical protein